MERAGANENGTSPFNHPSVATEVTGFDTTRVAPVPERRTQRHTRKDGIRILPRSRC